MTAANEHDVTVTSELLTIKTYLDEHGELPLKEASITLPTGSQSHWWIRNQTLMLHQGRQSEDKVKLLNEIGIV